VEGAASLPTEKIIPKLNIPKTNRYIRDISNQL